MRNLILAALLLFASPAFADEVFFGYGVGVFNSAKTSPTEAKVANLGVRTDLFGGFYWQFKLGYWGDGSGDPNRHNSAYISSGPGILVDLRPVEIRSGWGLAAITNPDSYLGGRFPQFNGELYLGLRDRYGSGIGVKYEHISSAGLIQPNEGRDFAALEISFRW